jgi:hypothetical protein
VGAGATLVWSCQCAGCSKARKAERELILKEIEEAPIAFDFFGPYIAREKLMGFLKGETK